MKRWICAQIGAREHYAIPRSLENAGRLGALYTDFWASAPWRLLGKVTGKGSLATRFHPDLAESPIRAFNFKALNASRRHFTNPYDGFLEAGEGFGRNVVVELQASNALLPTSGSQIFFGYDTGFLEPAGWIKERGGKTLVCQMDPSRIEAELVKEEEKRWRGWAKRPVEVPEAYFRRREAEWAVADLVMVNSEWTREALICQGLPSSKIVTVPLAYEVPKVDGPMAGLNFTKNHPLRVLFLGQVILRKGIQYLIEAAKLLQNDPVHFDVVGALGISGKGIGAAPANMTFHGPVSRDRTEEFYRTSGLFVLPTLSDGFALTQLEAMSRGIPVIATPNCGEVVTHGVDGLIIPPRDPVKLAEAIRSLAANPSLLEEMSGASLVKSRLFGLGRLKENLLRIENCLDDNTF